MLCLGVPYVPAGVAWGQHGSRRVRPDEVNRGFLFKTSQYWKRVSLCFVWASPTYPRAQHGDSTGHLGCILMKSIVDSFRRFKVLK